MKETTVNSRRSIINADSDFCRLQVSEVIVMSNDSVPPYGVKIHDAIVRGDFNEMKELYQSIAPAMRELKDALGKLQGDEPTSGNNVPYGSPILRAVARGELYEMRMLRDSVKPTLEQLEEAIDKLEGGGDY